ncbi:N-acetylmuramoyl-L-alanine amidase [Halosquirtibacter xylanolyticus]|uniref:N-acetylmuramoyl-L-alanine amidase n=1 Tax=Halosquirtibacter xylanolyticus TaxID=3374599 RepID=UPI003748F176|nr:N-acetylmuramoyl-L-alanine amidase [Prolixibacteraceae bacterium]
MRKIKKIILHCSDSDIQEHDNIQTIRRWHMNRGWKDIGYHYFISKDGRTRWGRNLATYGAHCAGHNRDSIGICLSGRKKFTKYQFSSLRMLLMQLMKKYDIPKSAIYPHNHFNRHKTCPNFNVKELLLTL